MSRHWSDAWFQSWKVRVAEIQEEIGLQDCRDVRYAVVCAEAVDCVKRVEQNDDLSRSRRFGDVDCSQAWEERVVASDAEATARPLLYTIDGDVETLGGVVVEIAAGEEIEHGRNDARIFDVERHVRRAAPALTERRQRSVNSGRH